MSSPSLWTFNLEEKDKLRTYSWLKIYDLTIGAKLWIRCKHILAMCDNNLWGWFLGHLGLRHSRYGLNINVPGPKVKKIYEKIVDIINTLVKKNDGYGVVIHADSCLQGPDKILKSIKYAGTALGQWFVPP